MNERDALTKPEASRQSDKMRSRSLATPPEKPEPIQPDLESSTVHLFLIIRPHTQTLAMPPFWIEGEPQAAFDTSHDCAGDAEAVVHAYCRQHQCGATVHVHTPRDKLWREDEIGADGEVLNTTPIWRLAKGVSFQAFFYP